MDGMLSQEEINALLNEPTGSGADEQPLSDAEKDAIGEVANISMGTAATTLFSLVNRKVEISTPVVSFATWEDIVAAYEKPCVFIKIAYTVGLDGSNILVLKENDVKVITDLMMGGDGTNTDGELGELHLSAISEAMNQMMGSAATSLSSMLDKKVDISPPTASVVDLNDSIDDVTVSSFLSDELVQVSFDMRIGDLVDSQIMQLYPFDFARDLYQKFVGEVGIGQEPVQPEPVVAPEPQQMPEQTASMPGMGMDMNMAAQQPQMQQAMPQQPYMMPTPNVNVQPAQFQPFNAGVSPLMQQENIDLIMDVPLEVTVELGRSNKSIKEILDFSPGTIIELNKLAGEPVDVLVNGKFVAKGEVVVIEENFGIRITEISK